MDVCADACSRPLAVQEVSTHSPEPLQLPTELGDLARLLAEPEDALHSLKRQQAAVQVTLWEMEETMSRCRSAVVQSLQFWQRRRAEAEEDVDPVLPDSYGASPRDVQVHDGAEAEAAPEPGEPRAGDLRTEATGALGMLEHVGQPGGRRDSHVMSADVHRLLERIRQQDTRSSQMLQQESAQGLWPQLQLRCQRLVQQIWFEIFISMVIVANSVMIGFESQLGLEGHELHWSAPAELVFLAIYAAEIVVRWIAGQSEMLRDGWFLFDAVLVFSAFVEQVVNLVTGYSAEQIMVLRLLRLIRLVRTFRMIKQIRSIWRLVYGLVTCGETMCSTFALLSLVLYVFGVLGVDLIASNAALQANPSTNEILLSKFSSLGITVMTLSQFVTMDSIAAIYVPLISEQPGLFLYFLALVTIVSIALMNLVTAVLVEGALEHARLDREQEEKLSKITTKNIVPEIVGIFDSVDLDGSGEIGIEEMAQFDQPGKHGRINRRILDRACVDSMVELFRILDVDDSGRITREEFEEGLLNIFLREVPVASMQMMKMLRIMRDSLTEVKADVQNLQQKLGQPLLKGLLPGFGT